MKPETDDALRRAHAALSKAETMLAHDYPDETGRLAYGAGLNAARGFIFERTERFAKTHSGSQTEFSLIRDDPAFTDEHRRFLGRTYTLKTEADYGPGRGADTQLATEALADARALVAAIEAAIAVSPGEKDQS